MKKDIFKIINKKSGFVILFSMVISSIVFSVALGIATIAYREATFNTLSKNTGEAFYAADTGAECALYYDNASTVISTGNVFAFGQPTSSVATVCASTAVNLNNGSGTEPDPWVFHIYPLGATGKACAVVSLWRDNSTPVVTTIDSRGYNVYDKSSSNCSFSGTNRVERHIELTY